MQFLVKKVVSNCSSSKVRNTCTESVEVFIKCIHKKLIPKEVQFQKIYIEVLNQILNFQGFILKNNCKLDVSTFHD